MANCKWAVADSKTATDFMTNKKQYRFMTRRLYVLGTFAVALLASCGGGDAGGDGLHAPDEEKKEARQASSGEIVLSHDAAREAGVMVSRVAAGDFSGVIPAAGMIMEAAGDESAVVSPVAGTVSFSRPLTEGARVAKGAAMFVISGGRIQDGDPSERARVAYEAARREYDRLKGLAADRLVTESELNAARSEYERARLAYRATGGRRGGGTAVAAPLTGYVKACLVKEGDYVGVGQPLASVTRNSRLYLRADVPQRHYAALASVRSARFRPAYSDSVYDVSRLDGRLLSVGRASAAGSAYIPVTFELRNAAGLLPGAYAEVSLLTAPRRGVLTLPLRAVTEEQGLHFVYIQEDADCYRKREVRLGQSDGERVEILAGLKPGERVVTAGAVHVRLAAASGAIPGHNHNH